MINKLLIFFICFLSFFSYSQESITGNNYSIREIVDESSDNLFEIGANFNDEQFKLIFNNQIYEDVLDFVENLPIKNSNLFVQNLVYKILISEFSLTNLNLSFAQDKMLFNSRINKLFDSARFSEIDIIHSKTSIKFEDENLNLKKVEGFFLRNEFRNGCELIKNKPFSDSLSRFKIICSIIEQDFEKARFNISLLKERKKPGDELFIELCFNIMGDIPESKSQLLIKNLEKISSLNPILLSSLQIAEVSPNFEHVKNASTSVLTFILSSPSSSTDIKLYTAEELVRQKRIDNKMLAEIYQLINFESDSLKDALKNYKSLSPVRSRSLLYQAMINENDKLLKFELIKILLKNSVKDNLFQNLSHLLADSLDFLKLEDLSYEDNNLIFKIFISTNDFASAEDFLQRIAYNGDSLKEEYLIEVVTFDLLKFFDDQSAFSTNTLEKLIDRVIKDATYNVDIERLLIITSVLFDFKETLNSKLFKVNKIFSINALDFNPVIYSLGLKYNEEQDYFNSLKILFKILENREVSDLNGNEIFLIVKTLKDLNLNEELKLFVNQLLLNK